ncbi:hypothetical protein GLOIN_2v1470429 [Rhizophagus clarus]|uniref:Uncharacterized protein n=1 Tax=Rhizophagus clarus TaxID=94130 RepID=A0A8H3LHB7_9GLOM|nr:hypothetical protein GLOIN_2v1470429 [Rhizophagus clarus]
MSDELLTHKNWLEFGEPFEEDDEVLAFKEAKKREAHKNGARENDTINREECKNGNMFGVYISKDVSSEKSNLSNISQR